MFKKINTITLQYHIGLILILFSITGCGDASHDSVSNNPTQNIKYVKEGSTTFPVAPVPEIPTLPIFSIGLIGLYFKQRFMKGE